ncbi:MAG: hypothetical protein HC942_00585 [Microcoleus sp. SU_5_6]|nr:hypothetical protein [Microcoleus sp. SU_5_6]
MTATTDRPLKHFCIEDLKSADLTGISLIPQPLTLRLDFTFDTGIYDTSIEFYQLVHHAISQPVNSDSEDSCFWVGNAELRQLTEDKSQILSALSYPFKIEQARSRQVPHRFSTFGWKGIFVSK